MRFLIEFRKFAMRGNAIELAIAVVIGAAFGKIISSLVDGIIMPSLGLLLGGINIADKSITVGNAVIKWGMFLQSIIDFTIIAFSLFIAIKLINRLHIHVQTTTVTKEQALLTEIRDLLKKDVEGKS